jgi:acetyltransferase-like isoleucine patch superfamily enzyme
LRRFLDLARVEIGNAGATDSTTGELFGSLTARDAIDSGRASVGAHTYGSFTVHVGRGERARIHIGDYCSIAVGVEFVVGGNHRTDWVSTYPFRVLWEMPGAWSDGHPRSEPDIVVGSDVWIGAQALILPGVVIGHGAVIAARAVVTKDVRPYAIVAGAPAREVRRRFNDEQVHALLQVRWWEWPETKVRNHIDLLSSPDVDGLIRTGGERRAASP